MSMQMYILSDRQVGSIAEWQAAIDAEGYPLQLDPEMQFERLTGFLPSHLRGELTGFECYRLLGSEFRDDYPALDVGQDWKFALSFVWLGSRWNELIAAWMAGTAYAQATAGVIFDGEGGGILTAAQARKEVYELEHPSPAQVAAMEEIRRRFDQKS